MLIFYIFVSLLFSAFFSGMEMAFISSSKMVHEVEKKENNLTSRILDIFYRKPEEYISTMLVGNNIALVVYGLLMAKLLEPFIQIWLQSWFHIESDALVVFIQSILSTLLILFTGEFIPKTIFKLNPNFSLSMFAVPIFILYIILYPVSKFSSFLSFILLKLGGVKDLNKTAVRHLGKVDLDYFINQSVEDSPSDSDMETEVKIFKNALDFSNVRLRDCMVPRTEIVACDKETTLEELKSKFIETGLSKILVYGENIDDIIGFIHSSELFRNPDDWTKHIRTIPIVPETMAANKLMKLLMQEKKSMAVVVDEFGGTSGIVTLEDLVEEIFGEIEDEHDLHSVVAKKLSDDEYIFSGRAEIDYLNETFNLELPESDDYVTVAGLILNYYQKFPKLNESVEIDNYTFKIVKATATKIELVRMKVEN
jgi:CBS domain containing-hemolysin-like protein